MPTTEPPRPLGELFAPRAVTARVRADGTQLLAAEQPLGEHAPSLAHLLRAGADAHRDRPLIAERAGGGWRKLTWSEARAGADAVAQALPESVWGRLRATADAHAPREIPLTASWGCTESSPAATSAHFRSARCGCIGVPMPGMEVKLAPDGEKLEIRLRGPSITPGYFGDPAATAAASGDQSSAKKRMHTWPSSSRARPTNTVSAIQR
jgi:long-subunit acyl-CoA synthetase (AMP-forming)